MVSRVHDDGVTRVEFMDLVGGDVCLDFVNTGSERDETGVPRSEKLRSYADLVVWGERTELLGPERSARLRAAAASSPKEAEAALARARELREAIYRVFRDAEAAPPDLEVLARWAGEAALERRLVRSGDGYAFGWPESDALDQVLWPVAVSAAELLTSADRERVKECAADTCNWLFLDMSRNRSRRWCDMKECGNRAKARRFYKRQRAADSA